MALAVVTSTSNSGAAGSGQVLVNNPSLISANNILVAFGATDDNTGSMTAAAGFTLIQSQTTAIGKEYAWYRVADSGDHLLDGYGFGMTGSGAGWVALLNISGNGTATPLDVYRQDDFAPAVSFTVPALSLRSNADMGVLCAFHGSAGLISPDPTGFTPQQTVSDGANGKGQVWTKLYAATGSTGTVALSELAGLSRDVDTMFVAFLPTSGTVSVTAPSATVTTGGPNMTVSWSPTAGLLQTSYRIRVRDAALTTTYYDSGVVASAATSVAVDLVAAGVGTDTTGSTYKVTVDLVLGNGSPTANSSAFDVQWGVVTCAITDPVSNERITAAQLPLSWTFASTRGFTQSAYRARILSDSGVQMFDSGWVTSAATSATVGFTLTDNTTYQVGLQLKNQMGVLS